MNNKNLNLLTAISSLLYKMANSDQVITKIEQKSIYTNLLLIIEELDINIVDIEKDKLLIDIVQKMRLKNTDFSTYIKNNTSKEEQLIILDKILNIAISDYVIHEDEVKFIHYISTFTKISLEECKLIIALKKEKAGVSKKKKKLTTLQKYDYECSIERTKLISKYYTDIVGDIHDFFQENIITLFYDVKVKEILRFDYMTNLFIDGDKFLWIDFIDTDSKLHHLKVVINLLSDDYIEFNDSKKVLTTTSLTKETLEKLSKMCLGVFRRGYDKI